MIRAILAAAALFLPLPSAATVQARPMTPHDVARLEAVGAIAVSPDGSRVAYTTARFPDVTEGEADSRAVQQLKLAFGPGHAREFLPPDMNVAQPAFSPDGRTIAFLWAEKDGHDAVWGIPVDGGGHRKLAEVKGVHVVDYAWSPDGATIYMLAEPAPDARRKLASEAGFKAIVFEEDFRFNRMFAARIGDKLDSDPREIALPGFVSAFRLAPSGDWAAISTAPTPTIDDSYTSNRIAILDLAGGKVRRIVETSGKIGDFEISPDGRTLSLIAAVDQHDPAPTTLYLVDVASGALRALNAGAAEAAVDAEWLADGKLAGVIHVGVQSRYRVYRPDGSLVREIDPGRTSLTRLDAAGGTVALRGDTPTHPAELFALASGSLQRWTHHNRWLDDIDFGKQRIFTYTARDGQQIEGILIEPVGGKGPAPTILDVHGGPESHETNGWNTDYGAPGQVAAGHGYAVFLPNYRGSTAYGVEFSKQHQGDYAGKEFDDLVDAKRALVAAGIADADKTGITGGSYGGYATSWAATALSEHFAAAVAFVSVTDQISKFGTTEIPREMYLVHARKWPWEDWQFMLERSPIYHAGQARTPLLILHGLDDKRVDPGQSFELYRHVKTRTDTPVRLVLYPGEGHGNRYAAARFDYNVRMLRWFDWYLKGEGAKEGEALPPAEIPLPVKAIDGE